MCVCVSKFGVCVLKFLVCVCVVQLVEIGGVRREALLGVGPQTISVMEAHNLKVSNNSLASKTWHSFTHVYIIILTHTGFSRGAFYNTHTHTYTYTYTHTHTHTHTHIYTHTHT